MEPLIGQIVMFAGNFAPKGWAFCDGQHLAIQQYSALFSILGTTYGGDGSTVFALPDLRGRGPVHAGQGQGLRRRELGEVFGGEGISAGDQGGATAPASLSVNFIIAIEGVYPQRP